MRVPPLAHRSGVHSIASHPAVASGSFCTVTAQTSMPWPAYAVIHLAKYSAHGRSMDGSSPDGFAEASIDWTSRPTCQS